MVPSTPQLKHNSIENAPDISDKSESGWAAVGKSIREVDEEKIRDYKEDIDTILVFVSRRLANTVQWSITSRRFFLRRVFTRRFCLPFSRNPTSRSNLIHRPS